MVDLSNCLVDFGDFEDEGEGGDRGKFSGRNFVWCRIEESDSFEMILNL
jgi:hypothetical protein